MVLIAMTREIAPISMRHLHQACAIITRLLVRFWRCSRRRRRRRRFIAQGPTERGIKRFENPGQSGQSRFPPRGQVMLTREAHIRPTTKSRAIFHVQLLFLRETETVWSDCQLRFLPDFLVGCTSSSLVGRTIGFCNRRGVLRVGSRKTAVAGLKGACQRELGA